MSKIDTILNVADSYYLVNDKLLTSQEVLKMLNNSSLENMTLEFLGTGMIGFVLGWLLGFVNRNVSKNSITIQYLVAAIGALMGTVVMSFFGDTIKFIGPYGIGLGVGLIIYHVVAAIWPEKVALIEISN